MIKTIKRPALPAALLLVATFLASSTGFALTVPKAEQAVEITKKAADTAGKMIKELQQGAKSNNNLLKGKQDTTGIVKGAKSTEAIEATTGALADVSSMSRSQKYSLYLKALSGLKMFENGAGQSTMKKLARYASVNYVMAVGVDSIVACAENLQTVDLVETLLSQIMADTYAEASQATEDAVVSESMKDSYANTTWLSFLRFKKQSESELNANLFAQLQASYKQLVTHCNISSNNLRAASKTF